MVLKVLFFASVREAIGCDAIELDLGSLPDRDRPQTIDSKWLLDFLQQKYPEIVPLCPSVSLAVNKSYIRGVVTLNDGDEIALIPPLGGG